MKRREIIGLLGGAAVWPIMARAQQTGGMKRVAALLGGAENDPVVQRRLARFIMALADKNWVEGRNLHIDVRWGGGDASRTLVLARELVDLAPDAILATNTPTARALKE